MLYLRFIMRCRINDHECEMKHEGFYIFDIKDKIMICKFCNMRVDWIRRDTYMNHVSNKTRKQNKLRVSSSSTATAKQVSISAALQETSNTVLKKQEFIMDSVEMMVGANIQLEKAEERNMRTWLNKYVPGSGDLPRANTLRENYLPKLGQIKSNK